jgi:hypothetical protein
MLWYKSFLETRWRFLIGFALVVFSAASAVFAYPRLMQLVPLASGIEASGALGRRIKEGAELMRDYRGYVWSQWFRQSLSNLITIFAVLLGTGGLLSQASGGGAALFTLSLPVSRNRLLAVCVATGLAELFLLAIVPPLVLVAFSPAVGKTYGIADALAHGACLFVAGSVFYSLTFLMSTVFSDIWRPALVGCVVAAVLAISEPLIPAVSRYSVFRVMTGEDYFYTRHLPWLGLIASTVASAAMLYGAARNIARQDF